MNGNHTRKKGRAMTPAEARKTITPKAVADAMKARYKEAPDGCDIMDGIGHAVKGIFDVANRAFKLIDGVAA